MYMHDTVNAEVREALARAKIDIEKVGQEEVLLVVLGQLRFGSGRIDQCGSPVFRDRFSLSECRRNLLNYIDRNELCRPQPDQLVVLKGGRCLPFEY